VPNPCPEHASVDVIEARGQAALRRFGFGERCAQANASAQLPDGQQDSHSREKPNGGPGHADRLL